MKFFASSHRKGAVDTIDHIIKQTTKEFAVAAALAARFVLQLQLST